MIQKGKNKMKIRYGIILVVFTMLFVNCGRYSSHSCNENKTQVGDLVLIGLISTSFNESIKAELETTTHLFIVYGTPSGKIGDPVWRCSVCDDVAVSGGQWLRTN